MARLIALVTAVLAAATIVSGQTTSPLGNTFQPGRGAYLGAAIYFPDTANHVIVKLDPATGITTIVSGKRGTSGVTEGNSTDNAALWKSPAGLCTDGTDLYVADTGNHKIRKLNVATAGWQSSTLIGSGTSGDATGTGIAATLNLPTDCQFVGTANVYVADAGNNKIKKVVLSTGVTTILSGPAAGTTTAAAPATGTSTDNLARFSNPSGLCTDGTDLYVADTTNNVVRKVLVADGTAAITTGSMAGSTSQVSGFVDDATTPNNIRFNGPSDCVFHTATAILLVADTQNHAVRRLTVGTGSFLYAGQGVAGDDNSANSGAEGKFWNPIGLVSDASTQSASPSNTYVLEQFSRVRKIVYGATTAGALTTVMGLINTVFPTNFYACVQVTDFYCTDPVSHVVWKVVAATGVQSVFAGILNTAGDAEGVTGTGKLNGPTGIATDGTNFVVSDTGNHKLRTLVAAGTLSTPAGFGNTATCYPTCASGSTLANSATQQYNTPKGLAYRALGPSTTLYVADSLNHRIVSVAFVGAALPVVVAGTTGSSGDLAGAVGTGKLNSPQGICAVQPTTTNTDGGLLIMDTGNNKVKAISTATNGAAGLGFTTTGLTLATYAGAADGTTTSGDVSGATGASQRFNGPRACACDTESGTTASTVCFIADTGNNKIKSIALSATDTSKTMIVLGAADGTTTAGNVVSATVANIRWSAPSYIFRQSATTFLATDSGNRNIKAITALAGTTVYGPVAGTSPSPTSAMNANTNTAGSNPTTGTAAATDGNIALFNGNREVAQWATVSSTGLDTFYVADSVNHVIRRVIYNTTTGASTVTTLIGTVGTSGDSATLLNTPTSIVANGTSTLYIAETGNNKITMITFAADGVTPTKTVLSGPAFGTSASSDVVGADSTVRYNGPQGLAIIGNVLYVADTGNNKIKSITIVGTTATAAIAWGAAALTVTAGSTDSTTAASNLFSSPKGLAANGTTSIFVADSVNNKIRLCTVGAGCSSFAGGLTATGTTSGFVDATGTASTFNTPTGLSWDQFGNLYVADTGNSKVRKITSAGVVTSVVGTAGGTAGTAGNADQVVSSTGVYATATLNGPTFVWFSVRQPTIAFVADTGNNKIRVVANLGTAAATTTTTVTVTNTTTTTLTNTTTTTVTTSNANTTAGNTTTAAPTTTASSKASFAAANAITAVVAVAVAVLAMIAA